MTTRKTGTARRTWTAGAAILAAMVVCGAQKPSAKFTELQRHDLTVSSGEGVSMLIEIPAGGVSARHSHPGEDFGYLLQGTIVLEVDGYPPQTVKAGETFFTPRGHFHNARNIGKTTARAIDTYIIDKGKPVVIPE
jgi:quercetin dioxygenase-like cupin family protein